MLNFLIEEKGEIGTGRARFYYGEVFPFTAMVIVECTNVGLSTIFKAAALKGLNYHVFMLYSYAISALVLLPLCYLFHRKSRLCSVIGALIVSSGLCFVVWGKAQEGTTEESQVATTRQSIIQRKCSSFKRIC